MATKFCPQCGSPVSAEDRFCPRCGATLINDGAPQRAVAGGGEVKNSPLLSPVFIAAMAVVGILLIAAGLLFSRDEGGRPVPTAVAGAQPVLDSVPATAPPSIPFPNIPRISLADAEERLEDDEVVFVDVRSAEDFDAGHIAGAVSIPLGASEMDAAYQELPQNAEIITYCT